jgi:hypothetical protein
MIKSLMHRASSNKLGKTLLKMAGNIGIDVNVSKESLPRGNFYILITIDTELGFVKKDHSRYFNINDPETFKGYNFGIKNFRNLANKQGLKFTYFLLTHSLHKNNPYLQECKSQITKLIDESNELGLHLHPDMDSVIQENLNLKVNYRSCKYLEPEIINKFISEGKKIIKDNFNVDIKSLRWGNYGLSESAFNLLEKNNIQNDSSVCAGKSGHLKDSFYYNWGHRKSLYPYMVGNVFEIPVTTFNFFGKKLCADPSTSLLEPLFTQLYKNAKRPFFMNIITHTYEGMYEDGSPTEVVKELDSFITKVKTYNGVKFITISEVKNNL